jgi:hypothetical protein
MPVFRIHDENVDSRMPSGADEKGSSEKNSVSHVIASGFRPMAGLLKVDVDLIQAF